MAPGKAPEEARTMSTSDEEAWLRYTVDVPDTRPGIPSISLCGLCGNSGVINASWRNPIDQQMWKSQSACICPNGRARVKMGRATDKILAWPTKVPHGTK
jgi:hypothetical protein